MFLEIFPPRGPSPICDPLHLSPETASLAPSHKPPVLKRSTPTSFQEPQNLALPEGPLKEADPSQDVMDLSPSPKPQGAPLASGGRGTGGCVQGGGDTPPSSPTSDFSTQALGRTLILEAWRMEGRGDVWGFRAGGGALWTHNFSHSRAPTCLHYL